MVSFSIIQRALSHFGEIQYRDYVVKPSLPILYFGDAEAYDKSNIRVLTVGKNPSDNEFRLKRSDTYSFCRFPNWNVERRNLSEALNSYFETGKSLPWFSCFEPILNGIDSSYHKKNGYENVALHTDICSPIATNPTWSKLDPTSQNELFTIGFEMWKDLVAELKPDIMIISVPTFIFNRIIPTKSSVLVRFDLKKNGTRRKFPYEVLTNDIKLDDKNTKVVFGQAANTPFGTISSEQKSKIGEIVLKVFRG